MPPSRSNNGQADSRTLADSCRNGESQPFSSWCGAVCVPVTWSPQVAPDSSLSLHDKKARPYGLSADPDRHGWLLAVAIIIIDVVDVAQGQTRDGPIAVIGGSVFVPLAHVLALDEYT